MAACPFDWSLVLPGLSDHVNREGQELAGVKPKISPGGFPA